MQLAALRTINKSGGSETDRTGTALRCGQLFTMISPEAMTLQKRKPSSDNGYRPFPLRLYVEKIWIYMRAIICTFLFRESSQKMEAVSPPLKGQFHKARKWPSDCFSPVKTGSLSKPSRPRKVEGIFMRTLKVYFAY